MARRTNTAGADDDEVMQYFFGGGGRGQQAIDPMASAMQLLGFGQKLQESQSAREQQAAENLIKQAQTQQTGAKTASDIALAESTMDLNKQLKQASIDEALGRINYQTEQLANEKFKAQADMAKTMMADTSIPIADRMRMWGALDPAIKNMLDVGAEAANKTKAQALVPGIKAVYGKPEELKNLLAGVPQEILERPEIPWQQMNEELGRQQAGSLSGAAGGGGLLWNAPGVLQNVGKGIVNKLLTVAAGKHAPQVPYTQYTDPFEEVPKMLTGGPTVGPAGAGPVGGYTTGPVAAAPQWQYGTGTVGIPQEAIPVPTPMGMPSPVPALLSGGMVPGGGMAPSMALEMLLRKAGLNAGGAGAPFGTVAVPPQEEEIAPWQYGVGRMR